VPGFRGDAVFLGATVPLASSQSTTPTLVFGPGWGKLFIYHFIAGYTSGGGIARLQFGTGTTVDTGANYSACTAHFIAGGATVGTTTSRVSQGGVQVANDSTTNGRRGLHEVWNPSGNPKFIDGRTNTYTSQTPAAATAAHATYSIVGGNWWNNGQAQCVAMDAGGSVSLLTGSYITVYGIPGWG
jgi:hypothetical protein